MSRPLCVFLILIGGFNAKAASRNCQSDPAIQFEKTFELLHLAEDDQSDREGTFQSHNWEKINARDLKRRKKVAAIFAEGCFKVASDYASAAIIYQHGISPDHFYQAFVWANKALKLGDESQRWLMAAAIDRYLTNVGQKQLFGTQLSGSKLSTPGSVKWCLQPVEPSFPEPLRLEYVRFSVQEQTRNTLKAIGSSLSAEEIKDCEPPLKPSPRGTVPGFW